jgi:hypothetical protein
MKATPQKMRDLWLSIVKDDGMVESPSSVASQGAIDCMVGFKIDSSTIKK